MRVRELSRATDNSGSGSLPGIRNTGDYSVYPSGRMAIDWKRDTAITVNHTGQQFQENVRYDTSAPYNTWAAFSETGSLAAPNGGGDDFVLLQTDATIKTDFLTIFYRDWAAADETNANFNNGGKWGEATWYDGTAGMLPATESWDFLMVFKPTNFVDHSDTQVSGRSTDYRTPATLVFTTGSGWNENPADADFYNESEAAYTVDADPVSGVTFDMNSGGQTRFSPFVKARQWRSMFKPAAVSVGGTALTEGSDYLADVKPLSRAPYIDGAMLQHVTLESPGAVSGPDVGGAGSLGGTPTFVTGKYGNGLLVDANSESVTFSSAGNINFTKGAVEFWFLPNFDHDDGLRHRFWSYSVDVDNALFFEKHSTDQLRFGFRHGPLATDRGNAVVLSSNYSWKAGDWVHLRAVWDASLSIGNRLQIFVNGSEPTHAGPGNPYIPGNLATGGNIILGVDSGGANPMDGVMDEYRLYSNIEEPTELAFGGLTGSASEFLADAATNATYDLTVVDGSRRGKYAYFGSDSPFRGLNVSLATLGVGTVDLAWEYWNGTAWTSLELPGFTDGTNHLTRVGTIYWTSDPPGWTPYSVNGGPDLFYVRTHVASGSYTTDPVEARIKTDILLFQYCNDVTGTQTFDFTPPAPTEVELIAFTGEPVAGGVRLSWETASELSNLGFHVYRAESETGEYRRVTTRLVPGLGSSPVGARYDYVDGPLPEGSYFYMLEDVDRRGRRTRHGPIAVQAGPLNQAFGLFESPGDPSTEHEDSLEPAQSRIAFGSPDSSVLRVLEWTTRGAVVELRTEGFYVDVGEDGRARLWIPGLDDFVEEKLALPVKRALIDAVPDRTARVVSVKASELLEFESLPNASELELRLAADGHGVVKARRRLRARRLRTAASWMRFHGDVFQGDAAKVRLALFPIRYDSESASLWFAKRLRVRLAFQKTRARSKARRVKEPRAVARLAVQSPGLYAVRYEEIFGSRQKRAVDVGLSRRGELVPHHIEPGGGSFGPGSTLYFVSEGHTLNVHDREAVYELHLRNGQPMPVRVVEPTGTVVREVWTTHHFEEQRYYQAGLVDAADLWLWDLVVSGSSKTFPFSVTGVVPERAALLRVRLQGASDFASVVDHHVRLRLNGTVVGEALWDGENAHDVETLVPTGSVLGGDNTLEIDNVGDTGAAYSMVMLDRFEITASHPVTARMDGVVALTGAVEIPVDATPVVIAESASETAWLVGTHTARAYQFAVEPNVRYRVFDHALSPHVRRVAPTKLRKKRRVEWLALAPQSMVEDAKRLERWRRKQGLRTKTVAVEDVWNAFGHGERSPEAIHEFLTFAYQEWKGLRYVVLIGDASYDPKDYLGLGKPSPLPSKMVRTSYLWTASDPALALVHGDDSLPDLAIGRLPAPTSGELRVMIDKILEYERRGPWSRDSIVFITDDADAGGNFRSDVDALARGSRWADVSEIHLDELGVPEARARILDAWNRGADAVSYLGHGGIHVWAGENLLSIDDVPSMAEPERYPMLLTFNCLNGYFHFPYFDALAESLVKAESRGAIAAFSPSGLSLNRPARRYHEAMLDALSKKELTRLGDAVLAAQKAYAESGEFPELLLLFHLFGDPALKIH